MFTIKLPVVFYARVSSDKQREAHTIEGQLYAMSAFCERHGITSSGTYIDDGLTGDLPFLERPGGTKLLAHAKAGKFATVIVYLYDRFSRDVFEGLSAARSLADAGASPYSISEPFDINTPYGAYMFVNSLNNSQLWKAQFLEKTKQGSRLKARTGQWIGGRAPYGYRIEGRHQNSRLVIADTEEVPGVGMTEAQIVRFMFEEVAYRGGTTYSVAGWLNHRSVPTRRRDEPASHKFPHGPHTGKWIPSSVWKILTSTVYMGRHRWGKRDTHRPGFRNVPLSDIVERECPAIVSAETFERVQQALKNNTRYSRRDTDRKYLLRGLIQCELCQRNYGGKTHDKALADATNNERGMAYVCNSAIGSAPGLYGPDAESRRCSSPNIPGRIEHLIWQDIAEWLREPGKAAEDIAARQEATQDDLSRLQKEIDRLNCAILAKREERQPILALARRGRIDTETLDQQLDEIDTQEKGLKEERESLQKRVAAAQNISQVAASVRLVIDEVAAAVQAAGGDGSGLPWETRRSAVEKLVEKITVRPGEFLPGRIKKTREAVVTVTYRFGDLQDAHEKKM